MIGSNANELQSNERIDLIRSLPFFAVNLLGIAGFYYVFQDWQVFVALLILYYVRMFFVTGFQHRYFSHRSFQIKGPQWLKRSVQFVMGVCVTSTAQKGPLWWAVHHRHHHKHSDEPQDIHSRKLKGFWWSHVGWILCPKFHTADYGNIKDFAKYPELLLLEKWWAYLMAPVALGAACLWYGGFPMLMGGFFTSTFLLYHGTFCINSVAHMWGTQRFKTGDESRNNPVLNILTLGEGWHNNHHHQEAFEAQAITRWEKVSDITHQILWLWSLTGMVKLNLRKPA